jgi:hypothetical protein
MVAKRFQRAIAMSYRERMFRRSGYRFADKNMRQTRTREHVPIPQERNVRESASQTTSGGARMPRFVTAFLFVTALPFASTSAIAGERTGDAALGALSGAVVLGPVGAVAGAVVGYTTGPHIAHAWGLRSSPHRRTRLASAAAPPPRANPMPKPRPHAAPSARSPAPMRSAGTAAMPPAQSLE